MSRTWFGFDNLFPEATFTASSENSLYPATNLGYQKLIRWWHSNQKSLQFDGNLDSLTLAHHADFDITDNLVFCWCGSFSALTSLHLLIGKTNATDGYALYSNGTILRLKVANAGSADEIDASGLTLSANQWYVIFATWNSVDGAKFWVNGLQYAPSAATTLGSIGTTTDPLSIARFYASGGKFAGTKQYAGVGSFSGISQWHVPDPTDYAGFWQMDQWETASTITDQSGNGHHITANSLTESDDLVIRKGAQWLQLSSNSETTDLLCIDRRHNLVTNDLILAHLLDPAGIATDKESISDQITAAESLVVDLSSQGAATNHWLEFISNDVTATHLQIPRIYFGEKSELDRSFLTGYQWSPISYGTRETGPGGHISDYQSSDDLYSGRFSFKASSSKDKSILDTILAHGRTGTPFWFAPFGKDVYCVRCMNQRDYRPQHIYADLFQYDLELREVAA